MKIGYYGYDAAFRNLFPPIIKEAEEVRGHRGLWLPPQVRGVTIECGREMFGCNAVLMGMSSFQTQEELGLAEELVSRGIPVVIIEDVPGSSLRPKAKSFGPRAAALIIALECVRGDAERFGYQPQRIHYLGPPPHWGASYRQMMDVDASVARAGLTKRRGKDDPLPFAFDDVLVYVPGTKMPFVVNAMLKCAIDAGKELFGHRFVLGFAPHPGEKPEKVEEEEMFAQAFAERAWMREGLFEADVSHLTNPQRYAIADLSVISGGPTESIAAAYARNTHVAYYRNDNTVAFLEASGVQGGKWFVAELNGAITIEQRNYFGRIPFLMSASGQDVIRGCQELNFPLPETWDTAPAIVDFLEKVAGEGQ